MNTSLTGKVEGAGKSRIQTKVVRVDTRDSAVCRHASLSRTHISDIRPGVGRV